MISLHGHQVTCCKEEITMISQSNYLKKIRIRRMIDMTFQFFIVTLSLLNNSKAKKNSLGLTLLLTLLLAQYLLSTMFLLFIEFPLDYPQIQELKLSVYRLVHHLSIYQIMIGATFNYTSMKFTFFYNKAIF